MERARRHVVCPHCGAVNRVPAQRPAKEAKCGCRHRPMFEGKPLSATAEMLSGIANATTSPSWSTSGPPWCGPCRAMASAYERAAAELEPEFRLLKVNTEEAPEVAGRYGIRSIPMTMLFARGDPIAQTAGAMNAAGILKWVRAHVPQEHQAPSAASASG